MGIPVHRMDIEVVANLARVQQEWAAIDRAVGGGISGVNRSLGTGERALQAFENRFGEFGRMAETNAARAERAFNASFKEIQQLASNAIKMPALEGGGANLGAAQARAAAEAAREQAQAIALIEQAAHRAAAGEGELTQETRMYLAAAEAARIEAERNAAELGRQAIAAERLEGEYNQLTGAQGRAGQAGRGVVVSAGQQRAGMQQLSFQIGDVAQQFALGTNPMIIFAQQGGQVVQAISMMKGGATGFIGFLAGPWGAVILGAGMILGTLVSKSMESKKATNDLTSSLDVQKLSTYELIDAINKKADAEAKANKTSYEAEVANYNVARSLQVRTIRELEAAKAIALKAKNAALSPAEMLAGGGENLGAVGAAAYEKQVVELDAALKKANETVRGSLIPLVKREAVAAYDAAAAATLRYAKTEATLDANYHNHKITYDRYRQGLLQLSAQREKDQESVRGSANALIDAQARMEASTTHLSEAQAKLQLIKAQAARIKDPTSAQGVKLQEDLASAYRDVASAQQAARDDRKAAAAANAAQHHAETLAREANAMDASAVSGMALARAYLEVEGSTDAATVALGAAVIAEARHTAASEAARKGIDQEAQTRRVLANMIADGAVQAGKTVFQLRTETAMRNDLNEQLGAGKISLGEYNEQMKEGAALKPLIDLQAAAKAKGLTDAYNLLTLAIEAMTGAMKDNHASEVQAAFEQARQQGQDEIERLQLEYKLIGATNEQRAVELAMLQKRQQLRGSDMTPEQQKILIDQAGEQARAQDLLNQGTEVHNNLLDQQLDLLDALDQRARAVADTLADAFGAPGRAMGNLLTEFTGYAAKREEIETHLAHLADQQGKASAEYQRQRRQADLELGNMEIAHWGNLLSSSKDFFKQGSTGYKTLTRLEQVYGAIQLANSAKAIAADIVQTAKSIANALARGAADAAAGAAKMFASLGPLGFAAVAAMVAVLAGLGLRGIHGGGHGPSIPTAEDVQKSQGTGTVLGDDSAKSDSIAKSLALVEAHTNKDLEYSSEIVRALRSIDSNIGSLSSAIARQVGVSGGAFDTSGLGLGKRTTLGTGGMLQAGNLFAAEAGAIFGPIGLLAALVAPLVTKIPIIGGAIETVLKALFGTKKSVTLIDQGFEFTAQSVGQIVSSGVVGDIYQALQTTKKSKFFGISTGTKTSNSTVTSGLDDGFADQISLLIGSLRDGIVAGAKAIGIDGAEAMIDAFQLDLGKISTKDLKGADLEAAIAAVFSKAADDMASAVAPGLSEFQHVGEGLFETLTRLARDYQVVDVALSSIGKTFGMVGTASLGARENLIDLFGGLDNLTDLTGQFAQSFLTEAEQMAPVQAAVAKAMADLGLAGIATKDQFKQTVLGLDLTTEAGQSMYAQLLTIAPAFAKVQDYLAKLNPTLQDTAKTAEQLAAIAKERRSLEIQLMQVQGDAAGALAAQRADELAATDESNRALREAVYAAQDAAEAQKALADADAEAARTAEAIATKRRDLEIQLMEATGDAAGALAARRADELAAIDASLRPLQEQVYAAQDAAAAMDALNGVTMTAAEIAKTRRDLEIQLMEATGDAAGALAARRQDELAALDPSLRALQQQVYAAQDAASAMAALNGVTQTAAEIARARRDLEIQLMEATGDAAGALAARRQDELAALDPSLRALQQQVFAAQDAAAAEGALNAVHQTAAELAKSRADLEIRLMQAEGDAAGVLAAQRAAELAATDDSLKALLQQIYAAEDAKTAADALAQAQADQAQAAQAAAQAEADLAKQRTDLEIRLMQAQGDAVGALAAQRAQELAAADDSLKGLLGQIYAAEDAKAAQDALAQAEADAAKAAEDAAAAAQALADKRNDLLIQLMEAEGDAAGALAAKRQLELAGMDESLRALQLQVYAAQDAAEAQKALADAQAAAAQAADEAARAAQELADKRLDLEIRLMRATGDAIGATALERERELAALDPTLRDLQMQVYAAEDLKAAQDAQSNSLNDLIGKYRDAGNSLRDYRASLAAAAALSPEAAYRAAAGQFSSVASKARAGDLDSLGALQGAAQDFINASKAGAASLLDYRRDVARVANAVDQAIKAADAGMSDAERQLAAAAKQVELLTTINGSVMSVHDAILAASDNWAASLAMPSSAYSGAGAGTQSSDIGELKAEISDLKAALAGKLDDIASTNKKTSDLLTRVEDQGSIAISKRGNRTLSVTVDGNVAVVNPTEAGEPVPLTTVAA